MSKPASTRPKSTLSTVLPRGVAFFVLWMVLMQSTKPADLAVGAFATLGATWLSLHLLAPAAGHLRFGSLFALLPHFIWESVLAGIDVARRAFDPRLPLRTGFVNCPLDFPDRDLVRRACLHRRAEDDEFDGARSLPCGRRLRDEARLDR